MEDIEKTIRMIDLKEASGINADKEYAHVLELLCDADRNSRDSLTTKEDMRKRFAKMFGAIPSSDPEEGIIECADKAEEISAQIREVIEKDGFSKLGFESLIDLEKKLYVLWGFLMTEATEIIPDVKDPAYLSYYNEELYNRIMPMATMLAERIDGEKPGYGMSVEDWKEYYEVEVTTLEFFADFVRKTLLAKNLLDLGQVSLVAGFFLYFRSKQLAYSFLKEAKNGLF